ncbi:MAG: VpsF family polysaccharide biosynthesis protein [Beijerinckiaceae bacterium]
MRGAGLAGNSIASLLGRRLVQIDRLTSLGLALSVALLFGVSGGMLWLLGYNYDGITGSPFTKIHPFSYLVVLLLVRQAMLSGSPFAYCLHLANRRPASALMAGVSLLLFATIIARKEPGMAGVIDTFFIPALLIMLMADADGRTLARMESVLHALMIVNALIALGEFATGTLLFPYRFDGAALVNDARSTALQGHPLANAYITACYVLALLTGGRSLPAALKLSLVGLQCAALVAFGGRSAIVVTLLLGGLHAALTMLRTLRTGRVPLRGAAVGFLLLALLPVAVYGLAAVGFFDALFERFVSDSGSAQARVEMFALFKAIPLRDLIVGPNIGLVDSMRRIYGLESGIENPLLSMTLYHGAFLTLVTMTAFGLLLYEVTRQCDRGFWLPMVAFLILLNTSESVATKTTLIAKFAVILLCLCRRRPAASRLSGAGASGLERR